MSEGLTQGQQKLIKDIAAKNGFYDYDIQIQPATGKGENFLSNVYGVCITDKKAGKCLNLFLKCAQKSEMLRKEFPLVDAFDREILCYETLFPRYKQFFQERNTTCRYLTLAKFYGKLTEDLSECLVFEDMRVNKFRNYNKRDFMDEDHIKAVFQTYGEWHAFSLALKDQKFEEYEALKKKFPNIFEEFMKRDDARQSFKDKVGELVEMMEDEKYKAPLRKFEQEISDTIEEADKESLVFIHGDCWCNNILFQYESENFPLKPTKVCFVDWQVAKTGSPVSDLAYFFCSSAKRDILFDYKNYLDTYYSSLCGTLKTLGTDPDKVFPYSEFQRQWKKYCKFGLYMAALAIKIMLSDSAEAPDLQESTEAGQGILETFNFNIRDDNEYVDRIRSVVMFLVDNGFLE